MTEKDFTIGAREFKLSKVDAFKQFHIVRRISPILADLLPGIKEFQKLSKKDNSQLSDDDKFEQFVPLAAPLIAGFSKLSDDDSNYVLLGLLSSVEIKQEHGNWARVATKDMIMIQDMELPMLLQIAGRAFMYNLSSFFSALPHQK